MPGANNAIEQCLRVQPNEKVTLITDLACFDIGAALAMPSSPATSGSTLLCWSILRRGP